MKRQLLMDVVAIRIVLIVLLVMYHALCPFTGGWRIPYAEFHDIVAYEWLGLLVHQGQLEGMTFLSGLLLGWGLYSRNNHFDFWKSVAKKVRRILVPCFLFGILYYLLFYDLSASWTTIIYQILNGCGHLWYLPMIFWCFIITYVLIKYPPLLRREGGGKLFFNVVLALSLMVAILNPFVFLPLGLGRVGQYYVYFLLGFGLKQGLLSLPKDSGKNILMAVGIFVVAFCSFMLLKDGWQVADSFIAKAARLATFNICTLLAAMGLIYVLYNLSNRAKVIEWLKARPAMITLSGYFYGVYIYQQFILQYLYYKTSIPLQVSEYALPWIGFCLALVLSLFLCWISLKTRVGRFLIG